MKNKKHRSAEPGMLKQLQRKFIALNMGSIMLMLAIAFSAICLVIYQQDLTRVHYAMKSSVAMAFASSEEDPSDSPDTVGENRQTPLSEDPGSPDNLSPSFPQIGRDEDGKSNRYTPVAVYLFANGMLISAAEETTVNITDSTIKAAAETLTDAEDGYGTLSSLDLNYLKETNESGTTYVAFTDTSEVSSWQNLALILLLVSLAIIAIFAVINIFFSRWALRPVERAWTKQKRFVADASHDLKTPLTVILANNSILADHPESTVESQMQWIESTDKEAKQMQEMVNDLLLLARLDEEAEAKDFEDVDFSTLLEGEMLSFESVAFENGLSLDSNIFENAIVSGDRSRLTRLVTTLLDNACKYTPAGGTVKVMLKETGNHRIAFSVNNSGHTIDPEDLDHVFDRFYRADESRTHEENAASSHGLGLAIARAIAEEHGGTLHAESDEQNGTTFIAILPLK